MSYATAIARVNEIQMRLGIEPPAVRQSNQSFDKVLATANSNFSQGPDKLDTRGFTTTAPLDPTDEASGYAAEAGGRTRSFRATVTNAKPSGLTPELDAMFERSAARNRVPVELLKAVARAESGFRADAVSGAGAQGMMQLMPATGKGLGVTDPFDPAQSIEGGARYLRNALKMFGDDPSLALAAYNAGPGAVQRFGGIPPYKETQTYVTRVLGYAREMGLQV